LQFVTDKHKVNIVPVSGSPRFGSLFQLPALWPDQIGTEFGKGFQFPNSAWSSFRGAAIFFMDLDLAFPPTRDTEIPTLIAAGDTGIEQTRFQKQICPSVIEITFVGMYAETSPHLGFNDRKGRKGSAPLTRCLIESGRSFIFLAMSSAESDP